MVLSRGFAAFCLRYFSFFLVCGIAILPACTSSKKVRGFPLDLLGVAHIVRIDLRLLRRFITGFAFVSLFNFLTNFFLPSPS